MHLSSGARAKETEHMVDAAIRVIDRLIQLLEYRETARKELFKELVDPLYKDAEIVANDYLEMCGILLSMLNTKNTFEEIISWLEQRRTAHLALRIKIRAFLGRNYIPRFFEKNAGPLEKAILRLLCSGHTLLEEERYVTELSKYQPEHHTILSIMLYFSSKEDSRTEEEHYEWCTTYVKRMQERLVSAWTEVSDEFAEMKQQTI
jgi:hypothetical protein